MSEVAGRPWQGVVTKQQQRKQIGTGTCQLLQWSKTPFSLKALETSVKKQTNIYTNNLQNINSIIRQEESKSLSYTHLMVKSFIEFKFYGPLEVWRQKSQGCFWTNEYFAIFFNRFIVLFFWESLVYIMWPYTWKTTARILIKPNLFSLLRDAGVLYLPNTFLTVIWTCCHQWKCHNFLHVSFHIFQIHSESVLSLLQNDVSLPHGPSNTRKTELQILPLKYINSLHLFPSAFLNSVSTSCLLIITLVYIIKFTPMIFFIVLCQKKSWASLDTYVYISKSTSW